MTRRTSRPDVGVEQLPGGDIQVDRPGRLRDERLHRAGDGSPSSPLGHDPDAAARVVGEEERAVVLGGIGAAREKAIPDIDDPRGGAGVRRVQRLAVPVGEVRWCRRRPARTGSRRSTGARRRSALPAGALVAGPAEVRPAAPGIAQAVDLLVTCPIPRRRARPRRCPAGPPSGRGCGGRTRRSAGRSGRPAPHRGCPGIASPVPGRHRITVPSSATGSAGVRRSCDRSAPPSAVGGLMVPPGPGGSPHGLTGAPSWP